MVKCKLTERTTASAALAALVCGLVLFPLAFADAREGSAQLGGGNAGLRGGVGVSHANPTSNIVSRVSFAGTQGGQPENIPPAPQANANQNSQGSNGGTQGGSGGSGGNSATGGAVSAGSVVSNANAVNVINTVIVRVGQ